MCTTCGCNYDNYSHADYKLKGDNPMPDNQGVAVPPMPRQGSENPK
jgi:hypothetical protein